jgi:hypothetical protein
MHPLSVLATIENFLSLAMSLGSFEAVVYKNPGKSQSKKDCMWRFSVPLQHAPLQALRVPPLTVLSSVAQL